MSPCRTHRPQLLLSWVFLMILYIFPEAGLVLFMSLYQWVSPPSPSLN